MGPKIIDGVKIMLFTSAIFFICGFSFSFSKNPDLIEAKVLKKIKIPRWYHEGLYFDGKNIWVNNGKKGKTWVVDTSNSKITNEIQPIGTFTEAITSKDKNTLFVTDWDMKKVYTARIDNDRLTAQAELSVAPAHPAGAVWNGSNLFVITWTRGVTGTKYHILKLDDKLKVLDTKAVMGIEGPAHIAWDGKDLWVTSWYSRRIYKVNAENLEILGYFRSPVTRTTGIAWDGQYFWVTGTSADLYKMKVQN